MNASETASGELSGGMSVSRRSGKGLVNRAPTRTVKSAISGASQERFVCKLLITYQCVANTRLTRVCSRWCE
jgi:hypothetical protein